MRLWMDVMRHMEPVMQDHGRLFDAWAAGGVDGLVIGPLAFEERVAAFDPDPDVYRRFGVEPPLPPAQVLPEKRELLDRTLQAAKDRGWRVWIFTPNAGAGPAPDARGPLIVDPHARAAFCARIVDTMQHYPMADGAVLDGPEWGYEIAPHHQNFRSYIFNDLPETVAPACAELGYDYRALVDANDRLFHRLHTLDVQQVRLHGSRHGGLLGAFGLLGGDPHLLDWIAFRIDTLNRFYAAIREALQTQSNRPFLLAAGPRTAAFAPLCGYDLGRLSGILDVLLPKHYFWHRGFDGMYGTVARYVETLTRWNAGLSEGAALDVVGALFGIDLPGVTSLAAFDAGFPQEFFDRIVTQETDRALAATGDPERVVPWVDAGRKPHDGDPVTAGDLSRLLDAAERTGLRRFVYHHHGNLTSGEWAVITRRCGQPWQTTTSPPLNLYGPRVDETEGYRPPDLPVL